MVEINKKVFGFLCVCSFVGILFVGEYILDKYLNDDWTDEYFIGYEKGARIEHQLKNGYYDGLDFDGAEPTANELLDLAIDSYMFETASTTTNAGGNMETAGYRDGILYMYMYNYIEGVNSRGGPSYRDNLK